MAELKHKEQIQYYLNLGKQGYFPLFYREWICSCFSHFETDDNVSLTSAFAKLEKHTDLYKKIESLSALNSLERNSFIKLFLNEIDKEILNETYKYH